MNEMNEKEKVRDINNIKVRQTRQSSPSKFDSFYRQSGLSLLFCLTQTNPNFLITACAVATSCCISDEPCQWEKANFDPPQLRHLLTDRRETQI